MRRRSLAASAMLIVLALATACSAQGTKDGILTLSAGEATLSACPISAPVFVETLDTDALPTCEPVGQLLIFPDGEQLQLPDQSGGSGASSSSNSDFRYAWQEVGNWGIVAARVSNDCSKVQEWGNPEGLRRVHEAFGTEWACP